LPTKKEQAKSASTPAAKARVAASKSTAKSTAKESKKSAAKAPASKDPSKPVKNSGAKVATKATTKATTKAATKAATKVPTKVAAKSNGAAKSGVAANGGSGSKSAARTAKTDGKVSAASMKTGRKTPEPVVKTSSKGAVPASKTTAPGAKPVASKTKPEPSDTPTVPKKGPIDLAQHKSVAAAAAAVANARGGASSDFIIINGRRVRAISTKGITVAKKSKESAVEAGPAPTDQQIASIKTKLGKKDLEEYRNLLLAKRRQLVGMLSGMEDEALRSSGGNLSNMPVHMADMGSDVYEQDFTLGMAETERAILGEIDAALQRIEDKTFGVCQMTGKPITKARLDAKPWAKFTIEAERIAESGGLR
jgi:DnaK suppressor protein